MAAVEYKIKWDQTGEHLYETGVNHAVLYPYNTEAADKTKAYDKGIAWNGITSVQESPSGAEATALYADNIKYGTLRGADGYPATIEYVACQDHESVAVG